MLRTILGFAAGFVTARLVAQSGSVKKFKEIAREKAAKMAAASKKAADAAREEWRRQPDDETTAPDEGQG